MIVKTQAELNAALASGESYIEIRSERGAWLHVGDADSATVRASDSATVRAWGSATVEAWDSATVRAWGSATVEAWGSATVRAWGSATVEAWGSATVRASGSATVRAWDSATVEAWDSATVEAWGSATVEASKFVAVHLFSADARIDGGVVIDVTDRNKSAENWLEYHGIDADGGKAVLYKAVDDNWTTTRGTIYTVGAEPSAPDWRPDGECGGGLHLSPRPIHAREYHPEATHFVACEVDVETLNVIDGVGAPKCKVPSCRVLFEVDIDGERVTS